MFFSKGGKYRDFDDFHSDMLLVRENCCLYNPEQSAVRKDCDEVFAYYQQEYDKLIEKWQKVFSYMMRKYALIQRC